MRTLLVCLALLIAMPVPAPAEPSSQLVSLVQSRLRHYNLQADVSQFATPTVAALHLTLSSPESYITTRQKLKTILRNAQYK